VTRDDFVEMVETLYPHGSAEFETRLTLWGPETEAVIYTGLYLTGDDELEHKP